jgi:hypothetical protein
MTLRQSVGQYIERAMNATDDMFIAIETRDVAAQHTALAAQIGLLEMLRSELEHGEDNDVDSN